MSLLIIYSWEQIQIDREIESERKNIGKKKCEIEREEKETEPTKSV